MNNGPAAGPTEVASEKGAGGKEGRSMRGSAKLATSTSQANTQANTWQRGISCFCTTATATTNWGEEQVGQAAERAVTAIEASALALDAPHLPANCTKTISLWASDGGKRRRTYTLCTASCVASVCCCRGAKDGKASE